MKASSDVARHDQERILDVPSSQSLESERAARRNIPPDCALAAGASRTAKMSARYIDVCMNLSLRDDEHGSSQRCRRATSIQPRAPRGPHILRRVGGLLLAS